MKHIKLTKGLVAKVDDGDYKWLSRYKWQAVKPRRQQCYYAARVKSGEQVFMHDMIHQPGPGLITDHKDRDTLNNQRCNLRSCTYSQNNANQGLRSDNTSGYRGVFWRKDYGQWRVDIVCNYQHYYLGLFDDPVEAAKAYDTKARELFGEFAYQNFPTD